MDVATEHSLNQSMNSAAKHYSSMFFLPTFKKALIILAVLSVGGMGISTWIVFHSLDGFLNGMLVGGSIFVVNLFFDYVVSQRVLSDPIYVLRRTIALSLFCWILWLFFIALGAVLGAELGLLWWVKTCLLGFSTVFTLRVVVFRATSPIGLARGLVASLLQPFPCLIPFAIFWARSGVSLLNFLPFLIISPFVGVGFGLLFIYLLDRLGRKVYGLPSLPLFRAFMLNWVAGLNEPFEEFLEKLGEDQDVEVSFLKFDSSEPKAAIIVPLVHPGPFKNIGSSLLPSLLKLEFEREFGCVACVPLGILGHELDLTSQKQNHRIIESVIASSKFVASGDRATPFVKLTDNFATVCMSSFRQRSPVIFYTRA